MQKNQPYGMITVNVPTTLPIKDAIIEKIAIIKPGVNVSIDPKMQSICKKN